MKKSIALFLVFSMIGLYGNLYAKERRGAELVIQKKDAHQVKGELIAVKQNSLLIKQPESGADVSVGIPDIRIITIVKESKVLGGIVGGLLLGGVIGGVAGYAPSDKEAAFGPSEAAYYAVLGIAIGAVAGALIGWMFSAEAGEDKTIEFEGKSEDEIKKVLNNLRKNARVSDFQ